MLQSFFFFNTTETRGPLSIKAYEGRFHPTGVIFEDLSVSAPIIFFEQETVFHSERE